ncbi:MAG: HAD family hydrolase [Olsenella profusa]
MIKLVLSDMDGTLVPFGRDAISRRTAAAIRMLHMAGIDFGPATGREPVDLRRFFRGEERLFSTGIMANGKLVSYRGRLLRTIYLDHEGLQRLAGLACERDDCTLNIYVPCKDERGRASVHVQFVGVSDAELASARGVTGLALMGEATDRLPSVPLISAGFMCLGSTRQDAVSQAREMRPQLYRLCPQFDFLRPSPPFFDVLPKGWNKAAALGILEESLGIARDEIAFFGDSENDVAMLEAVPNSFAVENATPAAKAAARFHIGDAGEDAVAQVMEAIASHGGELVIPPSVSRD